MIEPCPCNGCTERFTACSDRCPKDARGDFGHKAWKERYHTQQKHLEANKNRFYAPWSPAKERSIRSSSKFCAYGRKQGGSQ